MSEKQNVTIELAGARYRMTSDADEDQLQKLANVVNERIEALGPKAARSATPAQLLAVVALGLVDDLLATQARCQRIEDTTRKAIVDAIQRIDNRLAADVEGSPASTAE